MSELPLEVGLKQHPDCLEIFSDDEPGHVVLEVAGVGLILEEVAGGVEVLMYEGAVVLAAVVSPGEVQTKLVF